MGKKSGKRKEAETRWSEGKRGRIKIKGFSH
jgi:hypothetical protein